MQGGEKSRNLSVARESGKTPKSHKKRPRYITLLPHGLSVWHKDCTEIMVGAYRNKTCNASFKLKNDDFINHKIIKNIALSLRILLNYQL